ncbi:uncharacterized protein LOC106161204 [Lingula anatina]|uniref:guanylate cyclase n=1 Tax=Lingula anatina TaxID=7574 RepID=A0A1S3I837_LINAN|nr:uncharacterized protein LOC106161204 [Lingula anatina]|eukprot:XP_013393539.1 uncharacterized protein LOC106161204 [Lingula anatina]
MAWFGKSSKIAPKDDTSMKSIHSALSHHVGTETPDSMTPSQLDAAILEMLNVTPTTLQSACAGPETKRALILQYPKTDEALENITNWPMHMMSSQKHYQSKERFSLFLKAHRYGLEDEQQRVLRELDFYTSHLELFVRWMYNLASEEVASGSVWKRLVAYLSIVQAKSELGIERSIGAIFYARGGFETRETYLRFLEAQDNAQSMLGGANLYADMVQEMYNKTYLRNKTMTNMIADMREDIRERAFTGRNRSATLALYWYDNLTFQIDIMLDIQKVVADTMLVTLRERAHAERLELVGEGVAFMIALLLCPMITKAIYMITSQMQGISMMLSAKTRELNKEKKRTDTLLYQMLPKTIAESLKRNEDVVAELYQDTTIFFSDIVGFTDISSRASPFQSEHLVSSAGKGDTTTYWLLGSDHFKIPGGAKNDSSDVEGFWINYTENRVKLQRKSKATVESSHVLKFSYDKYAQVVS